jgi:hypothetical protein
MGTQLYDLSLDANSTYHSLCSDATTNDSVLVYNMEAWQKEFARLANYGTLHCTSVFLRAIDELEQLRQHLLRFESNGLELGCSGVEEGLHSLVQSAFPQSKLSFKINLRWMK